MNKHIKKIGKNILSKDTFLPFAESRRFIFVFHDISNEDEKHFSEDYYSITVENFKKQLHLLSKKFEFVQLDTLVKDENLSSKKHYASIVFDDGFSSVIDVAFKILSEKQIPFAVFVNKSAVVYDQIWVSNLVIHANNEMYLRRIYERIPHLNVTYDEFVKDSVRIVNKHLCFDSKFRETYLYLDKKPNKRTYLDSEAIKYLYKEGVLIGSHSTDHYRLNKCTENELKIQLLENRVFLSNLLEAEIEHFAIPFGMKEYYNSEIVESIFDVGYKFVYSTNPMPFKKEDLKNSKILYPRFGVSNIEPKHLMFLINRAFIKNYSL